MTDTNIHPNALVEPDAELGQGVQIAAFSVIKAGAIIGDGTVVHEHVHITGSVTLGDDCEVFPQAVLGMAPQDFKYKGEDTRLEIGARNIIREQVSMHPGTGHGKGVTRIGNDGYFMVGAHIGHDSAIGDHVTLSNGVALGGYVQVGDYANLGGLVGVHQFTRIGHHAFVGALSYVACDVIPYGMATGNPALMNGLNVIGMQRHGIARNDIHRVRSAYQALFEDEKKLFEERLIAVSVHYKTNACVKEIVEFIKTRSSRPLCMHDAN